jgi:malate dehydrogenase (oxaloacetate-decarboxylating)
MGRTADTTTATALRGHALLRDPGLNKDDAFTHEERSALGLRGLLPPAVATLEEQAERAYQQYAGMAGDLDKAVFLTALKDRNRTLFYRLLEDHLPEMLPVVYTPTVGTVIQQYSRDFRRPGGVYLSVDEPGTAEEALRAYGLPGEDVDIVVVTDGEGILGIGDWGVGGLGIAVGKLAVYTVAAGVDPSRVVPVVLDVGTNNEALLQDPLYVGNRHPRVDVEQYDAFVDEVVRAVGAVFPHAFLHFEDFGADNATRVLQRYATSTCAFNDDIQGTGAVVLAAALAAADAAGVPLRDQRVVVFGAGTAGIGIADQLRDAMVLQGLSEQEATARYWCLGSRGLLVEGADRVRDFQRPYARPASEVEDWDRGEDGGLDLAEVVRRVRPHLLIGTSGRPGAFSEDVVREMAQHVERPVVLPLSNPTSLSEAVPADLYAWTDGRALVATGSPFPPHEQAGTTFVTAQANNALVFPGLGLGVVVSRASVVTDRMLAAAAAAVASTVDASAPGAPLLPQVGDLRSVSTTVATAVALAATEDGVARAAHDDWAAAVEQAVWTPEYRPLLPG